MRARLTVTVLILAACGPAPIVNPVVPTAPTPTLVQHEPDGCGMAGLQGLVGHPVADVATAVAAQGRPVRHRVLAFGSMIAQDYDAARVNFSLDAAGLVTSVRCG
jgi:hypothetical protein